MRFHVIGLPHTQTTSEYIMCAYTQKVIKFCAMMKGLGHEVFLYAGTENEAPCDELITVVDIKRPAKDYTEFAFEADAPHWVDMNKRVITELKKRVQKKDFICLIAGVCQQPVANALPDHMSVEFGVGYAGIFAKYKVFESYAWMHTVYGQKGASRVDGEFFDAVIPNYFDENDFPLVEKKDDYYLYIGRLIDRKGYGIAQAVCEKLGKKLIVAGSGKFSGYGEHVGVVDAKKRGELMSHAKAVFVPTLYIEPFGGVMVEANLCGTPVITTDWGAFTENVEQGFNGWRCRTFAEFVKAAEQAPLANAKSIRNAAIRKFSMDVIKYKYEKYFQKLLTLWDKGWYT